jgi:hypothetical protein
MTAIDIEQQNRYRNQPRLDERHTCMAPKARKAISFAPEIRVHHMLHIDDYTDDEIQASWYLTKEYRDFGEENRVAAQLVQQNITVDEEILSSRGLENRIYLLEAEAKYRRRQEAKTFVIREQFNIMTSTSKYEMASIYKNLSYKSKMAAYLAAVQDAKISRAIAWSEKTHSCLGLTHMFKQQSMPLQLKISPVAA